MSRTLLVTGATGYIARHIIAKLLNKGETVIGSARSVQSDQTTRDALRPALQDAAALDRYRTVALNLTSDEGWSDAMQGVDVLIHTASPFPLEQPKDPQDLIRPAVDGALRAIQAAHNAGVRNVVLTSSSAAIMEGEDKPLYDETDWTPDDPSLSAYVQSKTLAERAAWDFVKSQAPEMRLSVINPTFVQGAPLGDTTGTSISVIRRLVGGKDPMLPRLGFPICDVQDVAEAHVRAIDTQGAAGQRHLVTGGFLWFQEMAEVIKATVPTSKPATRVAPNLVMRILGLFDPAVRSIVPQLGRRKEGDNTRLREVLGISPRDVRDSVADTARWVAAQK